MLIVGIDEVGRGCWAGPVVAAAVLLDGPITGLTDSKLLSKARREALDVVIRSQAASYGIGWVPADEIDKIGLSAAVKLAMSRALEEISAPYDEVIIDGNINYLAEYPKTRALIKADLQVPEVSAASIIAKVARDRHMAEMAEAFPLYGFEAHVGYGTALHRQNLQQYGVSQIHRLSYKPIQAILTASDL